MWYNLTSMLSLWDMRKCRRPPIKITSSHGFLGSISSMNHKPFQEFACLYYHTHGSLRYPNLYSTLPLQSHSILDPFLSHPTLKTTITNSTYNHLHCKTHFRYSTIGCSFIRLRTLLRLHILSHPGAFPGFHKQSGPHSRFPLECFIWSL